MSVSISTFVLVMIVFAVGYITCLINEYVIKNNKEK